MPSWLKELVAFLEIIFRWVLDTFVAVYDATLGLFVTMLAQPFWQLSTPKQLFYVVSCAGALLFLYSIREVLSEILHLFHAIALTLFIAVLANMRNCILGVLLCLSAAYLVVYGTG